MESVSVINIAMSIALAQLRGLLVKGKLRWKEPFNEETVTETRQVATAQPVLMRWTGIPLDGQHVIRFP